MGLAMTEMYFSTFSFTSSVLVTWEKYPETKSLNIFMLRQYEKGFKETKSTQAEHTSYWGSALPKQTSFFHTDAQTMSSGNLGFGR